MLLTFFSALSNRRCSYPSAITVSVFMSGYLLIYSIQENRKDLSLHCCDIQSHMSNDKYPFWMRNEKFALTSLLPKIKTDAINEYLVQHLKPSQQNKTCWCFIRGDSKDGFRHSVVPESFFHESAAGMRCMCTLATRWVVQNECLIPVLCRRQFPRMPWRRHKDAPNGPTSNRKWNQLHRNGTCRPLNSE